MHLAAPLAIPSLDAIKAGPVPLRELQQVLVVRPQQGSRGRFPVGGKGSMPRNFFKNSIKLMCFRQNEIRVNLTLTLKLVLILTLALTLTLTGPKRSRVHERKRIHCRTTTVDSWRNPELSKSLPRTLPLQICGKLFWWICGGIATCWTLVCSEH